MDSRPRAIDLPDAAPPAVRIYHISDCRTVWLACRGQRRAYYSPLLNAAPWPAFCSAKRALAGLPVRGLRLLRLDARGRAGADLLLPARSPLAAGQWVPLVNAFPLLAAKF